MTLQYNNAGNEVLNYLNIGTIIEVSWIGIKITINIWH